VNDSVEKSERKLEGNCRPEEVFRLAKVVGVDSVSPARSVLRVSSSDPTEILPVDFVSDRMQESSVYFLS
jgi:hypothetical protein